MQQWPALLLAQNAAGTVAEAVGYVGLLLFVMRAPNGSPDPKWRWLERALPLIGIALALGLAASYGSLFDYQTEAGTRRAVLAGIVVALCALGILFERRHRQSPEDYQRLRWVLWGCAIGLPTFTVAELAQSTTIFDTSFGDFTPPDDVIGLLYLINGVLCLFVFEAIRRARVVSVSIPLRRVTILGLTLSIPALLLHHKVEYMQAHLAIPNWAWIVIGASSSTSSPGFTRAPPTSPTATSTASSTASATISAPLSSTPRAQPRSSASSPTSRFVSLR